MTPEQLERKRETGRRWKAKKRAEAVAKSERGKLAPLVRPCAECGTREGATAITGTGRPYYRRRRGRSFGRESETFCDQCYQANLDEYVPLGPSQTEDKDAAAVALAYLERKSMTLVFNRRTLDASPPPEPSTLDEIRRDFEAVYERTRPPADPAAAVEKLRENHRLSLARNAANVDQTRKSNAVLRRRRSYQESEAG